MRPIEYLRLLTSPWRYDEGAPLEELESEIKIRFRANHCRLTASGRSALYVIFKALTPSPGDEVVLQAFTCVAAANPIVWAGLKPVFADIDPDTLGLSVDSVRDRLTPRTRAILVQHTFGIPAAVEAMRDIASARGITLIEDCAHALGVSNGGRPLGSEGDLSMVSFGVDKQLSSKSGGAVTWRSDGWTMPIEENWSSLPSMPLAETARWLAFPLLRAGLRGLPDGVSGPLARGMERASILRQAVTNGELHGAFPPGTPAKLSGALAAVVTDELERLSDLLDHRSRMVELYRHRLQESENLSWPAEASGPLIRFPVLLRDRWSRAAARELLLAAGFDVTSWYDPPVFPRGVDLERLGYRGQDVPVAEDVASRVLCLPTGRNIDESGLRRLVGIIQSAEGSRSHASFRRH